MRMDSNTFMGLLIAALVVLFGLGATITTLIIKPLINLNKSITTLNCSITETNSHLAKNDAELVDLRKGYNQHETRITVLEKRKA